MPTTTLRRPRSAKTASPSSRRASSPSSRRGAGGGGKGAKGSNNKVRTDHQGSNVSVESSPRDILAAVLGRPDDAPGTVEGEIRRRMHAVRERRLQIERDRVLSESPLSCGHLRVATSPPAALVPLRCAMMPYAWGCKGASSLVGRLAVANDPARHGPLPEEAKPYAELWVGTHPNGPSRVRPEPAEAEAVEVGEAHETETRLDEYLASHPHAMGSAAAVSRGGRLPFLLKVLSVRTALSIQAHPDKFLARLLHERQPDVYRDSNHKPEMAVALTPFEALCSFMSAHTILERLAATPE